MTVWMLAREWATAPLGASRLIPLPSSSADVIFVLKAGEIVERGKHDELLIEGGLYSELYRLQFERRRQGGKSATGLDLIRRVALDDTPI